MNATEWTDEAPPCDAFESTLALIDGLPIAPAERARVLSHAAACSPCGGLVNGWTLTAEALRDTFEREADDADWALRQLTNRVMARLPPPAPTLMERIVAGLRPPLVLGFAVGALGLVLLPLLRPPKPPAPPNDCRVHRVAFEGADGMVLTAGDDMTVIWVTEHEDV